MLLSATKTEAQRAQTENKISSEELINQKGFNRQHEKDFLKKEST